MMTPPIFRGTHLCNLLGRLRTWVCDLRWLRLMVMKRKKLGLIHTSATLVPVFAQLCKDKLPNVEVFDIADDSLIKDVIRRGEMTPQTARRLVQHVASAAEAGADYIMVTCSSI